MLAIIVLIFIGPTYLFTVGVKANKQVSKNKYCNT